jgi:hypothetical protein
LKKKAMKKHGFILAKHKTLSLATNAKAFRMASWDTILFPSWAQWRR